MDDVCHVNKGERVVLDLSHTKTPREREAGSVRGEQSDNKVMAPHGFIISMKFNNKSILPRRDMFFLYIYCCPVASFLSSFSILRSPFSILLKPLVLCVPPLKLQSSYYAFTNKTHFTTLADLSNSRIHLSQSIKMATEQYFEDAVVRSNSFGDDKCSFGKWNPVSEVSESENKSCGNFDCSICLDSVHDPVVTLCGHLYCWPCIYKWIQFQTPSSESQENQKQPQCPVCKTEVSESSLVPLYGRGQTTKLTKPSKGKAPNLGIVIPKRPLAPCGVDTPRTPSTSPYGTQQLHHRINPYQSQLNSPQGGSYAAALPMHGPGDTATQVLNPMVGMFGEMVYDRVFGNSITNVYTYPNSYNLAGSASPRVRRHVLQADKSLNRMCSFLFCCFMLCLILF